MNIDSAPNIFEQLLLTPKDSLGPISLSTDVDDSVDSANHFEREPEKIRKSYKRLEGENRRLGNLLAEKDSDAFSRQLSSELNLLREQNLSLRKEAEESRAREEALKIRLEVLEAKKRKK